MTRRAPNARKPEPPTARPTVRPPAPPTKTATPDQQVMTLLSSIMGRSKLVSRMAGVQFGGNRDIYAVAGYVPQGQEKFEHYWGLYTRGDIAGRIVDMPAKTTWRTPPEVVEIVETGDSKKDKETTEETEFTKAFAALAKRLRLWHYCSRVDRLAGIGRYGVMMIGVRNTDDAQLKTPLEKVRGPDDIVYLGVYHEDNAEIMEWETDPGNPRFGLPRLYKLKISTDKKNFQGKTELIVHASRVLHVAEDMLEDDVYGRPRLQRPLNRLFDLDKVAASTGEAYWQMVGRILQAKINPDVDVSPEQMKDLDEKLSEMVHDLRRQFYGQGVELSWLGSDTPNVSEVADFYFSLIAGATGTPKRILFGSELGELASTTDQATYVGQINERQEQFAEPMILRAFIDRLIAVKALPAPKTGDYRVVWPTLFEESDKDKAAASLTRAQAAAALTPVGGNPRELVEIDEESNVWLIPRAADDPDELLPPIEEDPRDEPTDGEDDTPDDAEPTDDEEPDDGEPDDTEDDA